MSERTDCPEPGIYHDRPFEDYAAWRAVNSGVLRAGLHTPRHFRDAFAGLIQAEDTKDKLLGRATHCVILEPDTFESRFVVADQCIGIKGNGKRCDNPGTILDFGGVWFCGVHKGQCNPANDDREVITVDQRARALAMRAALKDLPQDIRCELAREGGYSEVSITWDDWGLPCKGRLDKAHLTKGESLIIDVKKCQVGKCSKENCQKAILNYRYDMQAAWYRRGTEYHTCERPKFLWVFVEDNYPFSVNAIYANDWDYKIGIADCLLSIRRYAETRDNPPGYLQVRENIGGQGLPTWYVERREEEFNGRADSNRTAVAESDDSGFGEDGGEIPSIDGNSPELDG